MKKLIILLFLLLPPFLFAQNLNASYNLISKPGYLTDHSIALGAEINKSEYSLFYRRFDNDWGDEAWIKGMSRNGVGFCYNRSLLEKDYYVDAIFGYMLIWKRPNFPQVIKGTPIIGVETGYNINDNWRIGLSYKLLGFYEPYYLRLNHITPDYVHNEIALLLKYKLN